MIQKIKFWFAMRKADSELRRAVIMADKLYLAHNKRYYVIADYTHRLRVLSWSELKQMKKQGMFSSAVKEPDFIRESFYYTPSRLGEYMKPESKEKKRRLWHTYYKAYRL